MRAYRIWVACGALALMCAAFSVGWASDIGQSPTNTPNKAAAPAPQPEVPEYLIVNGQPVGRRVATRDGDICLPCGTPVANDDVTYLVDGQRVSVHKGACLGALSAVPMRWLARLKPRGAFLDARAAKLGLSANWLLLGLYVLAGLIFGALSAHRAFHVGRNPLHWLTIGFMTNLVGYVVLLTLPRKDVQALEGIPGGLSKVPATYSPQACRACGAENHPAAIECVGCGAGLTPRIVSEVQKVGLHTH